MALDIKLLDIIACPVCKGKLHYQPQSDKTAHELICRFDRLAYPLEEGIPVLLENRARHLPLEEMKP
ncbi:Trm112 family protein [Aeromonas rivipollensis]|uniref:Trm112 family protein n=1 Tax=Aeromonas rivipollensis TaxID=948519 RepID=UPI0038F55D8C